MAALQGDHQPLPMLRSIEGLGLYPVGIADVVG